MGLSGGADAPLVHCIGVGGAEFGLVRVERFIGFAIPSGEGYRGFSPVSGVAIPVIFLANAANPAKVEGKCVVFTRVCVDAEFTRLASE